MSVLIKNRTLKNFNYHEAPPETEETLQQIYNKAMLEFSKILTKAEDTTLQQCKGGLLLSEFENQWADICDHVQAVMHDVMQIVYTCGCSRGMAASTNSFAKAIAELKETLKKN